MNEVILSNMLGCQTYCISDSPSNRYCLIGPIECNEKLIEMFKKGIIVGNYIQFYTNHVVKHKVE